MLSSAFLGVSGQYLASNDSKGFNVNEKVANLSYTGPTTFANSSGATLTATLTDINSVAISGELLTFALGSGAGAQSCSGTTDSTGKATCSISSVSQPGGSGELVTTFAGDLTYQPNTVTTGVTINTAQVTVPNVVGNTPGSGGYRHLRARDLW